MASEPTLPEIVRIVDRHEDDIQRIEQHYVSERLLRTMLAPITERTLRLEQLDAGKTSGTRAWLLNLAGIVVGVVMTGIGTFLFARGGH